jgi:Outer membrane receptor for ferric coprogen and ferric-rhodotorulic acid
MNPKRFAFAAFALAGGSVLPAWAQTPPAPSAAATDEEVVVLSPFSVDVSRDKGYRATNSISGSRLNTAIKEIPMPIEVITEKFFRDIGARNLRDTMRYSSGILLQTQNDMNAPGGDRSTSPGKVNNPEGTTADPTQSSIKIRGFVTDSVLRDGFRRQAAVDSVNISRVEVVRGPAALLYGIGSFGGIVNYLVKQPEAEFGGEITAVYGSDDYLRGTLDVTGPLLQDGKLAYRLSTAWEDTNHYTDFNTQDHFFVSPIVSYKPFEGSELVVDFETGKMHQQGISWQRIRGYADQYINGDSNERAGFYNPPGTDPRRFRWSGPDTYIDTEISNLQLKFTQRIGEHLNFLIGYNKSKAERDSLDNEAALMKDQGAAPASLRADVPLGGLSVDPDNTTNIVQNVTLAYHWAFADRVDDREQVRAELNWNFSLFENANPWLQMDNMFLFGHSEEKILKTNHTTQSPDDLSNYHNPLDRSYIRYGRQGDGSPDVPLIKYNWEDKTSWNQGSYAVYQGRWLDDRLTIVAGARRDRNETLVEAIPYSHNFNGRPDDSTVQKTSRRSDTQKDKTYQYGAIFQVTREISIYGLKADGVQPNFEGYVDSTGNPIRSTLASSKEFGVKVDLLDGKISGTISKFRIERTNSPVPNIWWAPTIRSTTNFDPSKNIVFQVNDFNPVTANEDWRNGAFQEAQAEWEAAVAAGAAYQKIVNGSNNWYLNASHATGAAYLDKVFSSIQAKGMTWAGWLYNGLNSDPEVNNATEDFGGGENPNTPSNGNTLVGADHSEGWDAQLIFTPNDNFQLLLTYAHIKRVVDSAGSYIRYPHIQDKWAIWYFPSTDWGLGGVPKEELYTDPEDTSTFKGYGTGARMDDTPEHQVSAWASYSFREGALSGLTLGAGGWWESPRQYFSGITHGAGAKVLDKNGNPIIRETEERLNVDLMVRYEFELGNRPSALQLNVSNVLDDRDLYGYLYAAPRRYTLEFSTRF